MDDGGAFWFEQGGGELVNCQSPGKCMPPQSKQVGEAMLSSMPVCSREEDPSAVANPCFPGDVAEQFLASDWNPFISMAQHADFNGFPIASSSNGGVPENEGISSSGGSLVEQVPSLPFFNRMGIPEIISCNLSSDGQITGAMRSTDFDSSDEPGNGEDAKERKKRKIIEFGAFDSLPPFGRIQTDEDEQKKDVLPGSFKTPTDEEGVKEKVEENPEAEPHKLTSKLAEENSSNGDAPKDGYIHLRAKRGQATNSHSLAERVRRQKISERMRFLQDLVPGCSKITGKAVMLDEIINYIQSLQRQVEFLSMKLATVNPELSFEIEHMLSKDILHSQIGGSDVVGFCPRFSTSQPHFQMPIQERIMQAGMAIDNKHNSTKVLKSAHSQASPLAQISYVWKDDLQNVMQMGSGLPTGHLDAGTAPPGLLPADNLEQIGKRFKDVEERQCCVKLNKALSE